MRLVKVSANNIRPGMFIAELDRPWLETPFALQGFIVRDEAEVDFISLYVDYVYVDVEYAGSKVFLPLQAQDKNSEAATLNNRLAIKADFQQAQTSFKSATESLDRVFSAIQSGDQCNLQVVRESVQPLITGVFHNKDAIAALVRLKRISEYRYQHGVSMAVWSAILGRHISLPMAQLEKLVVACAMCDIGMTRLPDSIIHQPDALTASQWKMVKMHPELGVKMVRESSDQQDPEVLGIIECHHERFDGSGYPNGHRASDIPLLARIAGLVDAYDAMITSRPHAHGLSSYEAIQQLISAKGELFQDALVEQFVQAIGLFPTGSLVEFNTGEVGIVVKQNEMRRLKPEVVIVLDSHKQKLSDLLLLDLTDLGEAATSRWITLALRPGSYGVNCEEYFI